MNIFIAFWELMKKPVDFKRSCWLGLCALIGFLIIMVWVDSCLADDRAGDGRCNVGDSLYAMLKSGPASSIISIAELE